jgi:hypothetical protein
MRSDAATGQRQPAEITVQIGRIELRRDDPPETSPAPRPKPPAGFAGLELTRRYLDRRWY